VARRNRQLQNSSPAATIGQENKTHPKKTKKRKQTKLIFIFFSKTATGNGEMGKIKRRRNARMRFFFGEKKTKKKKFESAEGGKKKRKCAKKRQTFGLNLFPSHSSELGPIHTFL
jgi:hypothetical protein